MFLGIAVGDALGLPIETLTHTEIQSRFGLITEIKPVSGNRYYQAAPCGTTSDDLALSLACAKALLKAGKVEMQSMADEHVAEYQGDSRGYGRSTRAALEKLANGASWKEAAVNSLPSARVGNGVAMKIAPIAAYIAARGETIEQHAGEIHDIACMTHRSRIGVQSAFAQAQAVLYCLTVAPASFSADAFIQSILSAVTITNSFNNLPQNGDDLSCRFRELFRAKEMSTAEIIARFGGGSSYVYDSLPFTYAFFLKNPNSIESLYEVVNAGGDTDSNGSMLAALLGALNGAEILPERLYAPILRLEELRQVAEQFCRKFEITT